MNFTKSAKSAQGADCDSDHVPVVCKLQIKLKHLKKPNQLKFEIDL